jgi:molybdopterin synthase catalytic subunit
VSTPLLVARVVGEPLSVSGVVRDPGLGQSVAELQYVGPPTAGEVIRELAEEFTCDDVDAVAVSHHIGLLGIGDVAPACAGSTGHRGQTNFACAEPVDDVKLRLPIWKRQVFSDGEEEWVACP